ncbi:hypothetical protein K402DRAFT_423861 [Aulographum hederae CBS 113979]|uniref:Alpha/beta-hydrolase n=1 Tax=Aulographum hederae CBS 113979 TaxID=1176131 RepID=A0A6G1GRC0_9PEZI|nr:hypothetical protein K402DRAFT_423861 [Aulographum hederae CBS 113979]
MFFKSLPLLSLSATLTLPLLTTAIPQTTPSNPTTNTLPDGDARTIPDITGLAAAAAAAGRDPPDLGAIALSFPPGVDSGKAFLSSIIPAGPFNVSTRSDPQFPGRTIYVPLGTGEMKVPVVAWENGICYKYGTMYADFLTQLASYGYLAIAPGPPYDQVPGFTTYLWQRQSIDQALAASIPGLNLDTTKIAIGGHSCGAGETERTAGLDSRVTTNMVFNGAAAFDEGTLAVANKSGGSLDGARELGGASGATPGAAVDLSKPVDLSAIKCNETITGAITQPTLWLHGGATDIGVAVETDYACLKKLKPALLQVKASINVGHLMTYFIPRGGITAEMTLSWLGWQLKGDLGPEGMGYFVADGAMARFRGWNITMSGMMY